MNAVARGLKRWMWVLPLLSLLGCRGQGLPVDLFVEAAGALGPEAHQDRVKVVNPVLLSKGNPRLSDRALQALRDAGYEVMGGEGEEDPGKATIYFTVPEALGEGRYSLRIYVSLGVRPGNMSRGDSWWQVDLKCDKGCSVQDIRATDAPGWSRRSSGS